MALVYFSAQQSVTWKEIFFQCAVQSFPGLCHGIIPKSIVNREHDLA